MPLAPLAKTTKPRLIGYARASTEDQDNRRQIDELVRFGVPPTAISADTASRRGIKRPGWQACWQDLRNGDLLVIQSIDRLGRDLVEIIMTIRALHAKGAQIKTLNADFDTTTDHGTLMFEIVATIAEWEVRTIRERTMSGLVAARARGVKVGRKPKITHAQALEAMARIQAGESGRSVAAEYRVKRQTIYRKVDEARRQEAAGV